MLEKENLTPFQIQLLLYYLTAEPSKRTVTDSARSLNVSKWVVTRTLDTLEKLNIVERLENRKTVLTVPGVKLAEKYQKQRKVLEKYMQYQDIPPAQIKENALRALAARFSDEFMDRLAGQGRIMKDLCIWRQKPYPLSLCPVKIKWKDASRSCNTYMTENSVTAALTGVMYFFR